MQTLDNPRANLENGAKTPILEIVNQADSSFATTAQKTGPNS
jgi:hypothetical protein